MRRLPVIERKDWRAQAEKLGFVWHSADDQPYWDETAAFAFSIREIEDDIEAGAAALEELCFDVVNRVVASEELLEALAIPRPFWQEVFDSWQRGDRNLYGRFDFAYDGKSPPKLLEYNADTPTGLFETGVFQWLWLEEMQKSGALPGGTDQFNSLHESLIAAFKGYRDGVPYRLHLACASGSAEDRATVDYLKECADQAGLETVFLPIESIGLARDGRFVDLDNAPIETLFKLYPWEWLMREDFGRAIPGTPTRFIEPPWKSILSNKGLLALLWRFHKGHPNLVPAYFAGEAAPDLGPDYVEKPLYSREGANIRYVSGGVVTGDTGGPYGGEGVVRQQRIHVPDFGWGQVILGAWMVASQPAGMLVREDRALATGNSARFVPHIIEA
jgi:glutathionylspermidine synthase